MIANKARKRRNKKSKKKAPEINIPVDPEKVAMLQKMADTFHEMCPGKEFGPAFFELFSHNILDEYNALEKILQQPDLNPMKRLYETARYNILKYTINCARHDPQNGEYYDEQNNNLLKEARAMLFKESGIRGLEDELVWSFVPDRHADEIRYIWSEVPESVDDLIAEALVETDTPFQKLLKMNLRYQRRDRAQEKFRSENEPDPADFLHYDIRHEVQELKSIINDPGQPDKDESTHEGLNPRFESRIRAIGQSLFDKGGNYLMRNFVGTYVPKHLHRSCDYAFDGVGEWRA